MRFYATLKGGLVYSLTARNFSTRQPLARRDVPLARARGVRDRALRKQGE